MGFRIYHNGVCVSWLRSIDLLADFIKKNEGDEGPEVGEVWSIQYTDDKGNTESEEDFL